MQELFFLAYTNIMTFMQKTNLPHEKLSTDIHFLKPKKIFKRQFYLFIYFFVKSEIF